MPQMNVEEWATLVTAVFGALATVGGVLSWVYRKYVSPVHKQIKNIFYEASSNGGASIKDTVTRIDKSVSQIMDHLAANAHRIRIMLQPDKTPGFEADGCGNFLWANDAYLELCGRALDDIEKAGWLNNVDQTERQAVHEEWLDAVAQSRDFDMHFTIRNHKRGEIIQVRSRASVLRGIDGKVMGYMGTVDVLSRTTK